MPGRRFAILVGNAVFPEDPTNLPALRCAANDVKALGELLAAEKHGSYEICPIVDKTHDVGRREIYKRLRDAKREDLVLIYFSGHGKLDEEGNLYLATRDTQTAELPPTSIPVEDIRRYMRESNAGSIIVILDCCYSGSVKKMYKGDVSDQAIQAIRGLEGEGKFFLTAGTDTQLAVENEADENSLLTKHIIEGIRSGKADSNSDGRVSFQELCSYVQKEVPTEGKQKPKAWFLDSAGDVTVALTGWEPFSIKKKAVTKKLYEMASRDFLNDYDVSELLSVVNSPDKTIATPEKTKEWIDLFYSKLASEGDFVQEVHRRIAEIRFASAHPSEGHPKRATPLEASRPLATSAKPVLLTGLPLATEMTKDPSAFLSSLWNRSHKTKFFLTALILFSVIVSVAIAFHSRPDFRDTKPYPTDAFWTGNWKQSAPDYDPGTFSLQLHRGPRGFEGLLKYERPESGPPCVLTANLDLWISQDTPGPGMLFESSKVEAVGACPKIDSADGRLTGNVIKASSADETSDLTSNALVINLYVRDYPRPTSGVHELVKER
jgi:hypothetical protein